MTYPELLKQVFDEKAALSEIAKTMERDPIDSMVFGLRDGHKTDLVYQDMYRKMLEHIESLPSAIKNDIRDGWITAFFFYLGEFYYRILKKQPEASIIALAITYYKKNEELTNRQSLEEFLDFVNKSIKEYKEYFEIIDKKLSVDNSFENLQKAYNKLNEHIIQARFNKLFNGLRSQDVEALCFYLQVRLNNLHMYILNFFLNTANT